VVEVDRNPRYPYKPPIPLTVLHSGLGVQPAFEIVPIDMADLAPVETPGAVLAADKIRRSVASHDFQTGGNWQRLTVSVGIASVSHERMNQQDLITEAYNTLRQGRVAGQGPNRTFTETLTTATGY